MICLLPPLRIRNRYTEDWVDVWKRELLNLNVDFFVVEPFGFRSLTKYFTNVVEAVKFECFQICKVINKKFDTLLCLDADFPGLLAAVIPILKIINPELKTFGYLHAGSWCNGDIFLNDMGKGRLEVAIFELFDGIFVATEYHKAKILSYLESFGVGGGGGLSEKIKVVGFPFYVEDVYSWSPPISFSEKSSVLFVGRREQSCFDDVCCLVDRFGGAVLNAKNRREYFELLNLAKVVVSMKIEETFGLISLEAYALGGIPLSPNRYSYPEVFGGIDELLYADFDDLVSKLDFLLGLDDNCFCIELDKYRSTISLIVNDMIGL